MLMTCPRSKTKYRFESSNKFGMVVEMADISAVRRYSWRWFLNNRSKASGYLLDIAERGVRKRRRYLK
jgi:hypothetical protein